MLPGTAHQQPRPLPPPSSSVIDWPRVCVCARLRLFGSVSHFCVCVGCPKERERKRKVLSSPFWKYSNYSDGVITRRHFRVHPTSAQEEEEEHFLGNLVAGDIFLTIREMNHTHTHTCPLHVTIGRLGSLSRKSSRGFGAKKAFKWISLCKFLYFFFFFFFPCRD